MTRRMQRRERGASAVEMAIILPVLLLTIGGIVDFGRMFFTQLVLTNAARDGVRTAIVVKAPQSCGTVVQCITARTQASAAGIPPAELTVTVASTCEGTGATVAQVDTAAVFNWTLLGLFLPPKTQLTSSAQMGCL